MSDAEVPPLQRSLVHRRRFALARKRERDAEAEDEADEADGAVDTKPLAACLDWVRGSARHQRVAVLDDGVERAEEYRDLEYLVLSHQVPGVAKTREFEAYDEYALRAWARKPCWSRHAAEVIWTSCKAYAELDMYSLADFDAPAVADAFVAALDAGLRERFASRVARTDVLVLDASRPGEKVSRHVVIDAFDAEDAPLRFASSEHVRAFVASIEARAGFTDANRTREGARTSVADYAVYSRTGRSSMLRTYGSTKAEYVTRYPLLLVGGKNECVTARGRLHYPTLARSLVTWPRVTDETHLLRMDTAELGRVPPALRASVALSPASGAFASQRRSSSPSLVVGELGDTRILLEVLRRALACPEITGVTQSGDAFFARTNIRACPFAKRTHHEQVNYFIVNVRAMRVTRRCYSCTHVRCAWTPLEFEAAAELAAVLGIARPATTSTPPPSPRRALPSASVSSSSPSPPPPSKSAPPELTSSSSATYAEQVRALF